MYQNVNDSTNFALVRFLSYNKMCKLLKNQNQNSKRMKIKCILFQHYCRNPLAGGIIVSNNTASNR